VTRPHGARREARAVGGKRVKLLKPDLQVKIGLCRQNQATSRHLSWRRGLGRTVATSGN